MMSAHGNLGGGDAVVGPSREVEMRARTAAPAVLIAWVLVGCGTADGGTGGTGSGADLVDCGQVSLGQGESTIPAAKLDCLARAADAGDPATLAVLAPTTEGDLIATTYSVVGVGTVNVVVDSTADRFAGSGAGITVQTCAFGVEAGRIEVRDCTEPQAF